MKYKNIQKHCYEDEAGFHEHMEKSGGHGQVWAKVHEDQIWYYQEMLQAALDMKEEDEEITFSAGFENFVKDTDVKIKSPEKKAYVEDNPVEGSQKMPETPAKKPRRA